MFLNLNSEQQHALDAAKQAFGPMLEGLVKYSIPITLVTFVLGLIIALFTALMRISTSKILRSIFTCLCIYYSRNTNDSTTIYHILWYSRIR
ncbi:cystine transport system permease protein [Staphylococcus aureus]|nr:cystine transport system permease protein [Staphylococcus aureus]